MPNQINMNKILVPLNLSSDYQHLLNYALSFAQKSRAEVTFIYVGSGWTVSQEKTTFVLDAQDALETYELVNNGKLRQRLAYVAELFLSQGFSYTVKMARGTWLGELTQETKDHVYDLVLVGTSVQQGIAKYISNAWISRLIGTVKAPVFLLPPKSPFNEIGHITYAVDLTDYDPGVVKQVKAIASLFDAKLTIAHVNIQEQASEAHEHYVTMLDQTISDTLDYPKVHYRFFDHKDPLSGIKKLVNINDSQILAMTNRKRFSWKELFSSQSLTRKMAKDLSVPVLAFRKQK